MKIKGVTKNLKKLKNNNSKNISRNFSGAVEDSVVSVQFQIVPCFSLHCFSRSIGPFQCLVIANYRVLICCICHFQRGSLFFVYFGFLCLLFLCLFWLLPWWLRWQSICLQCGRPRFDPWVGKILWRRKWQPTPVLLPGKSHGQRSIVGYSP